MPSKPLSRAAARLTNQISERNKTQPQGCAQCAHWEDVVQALNERVKAVGLSMRIRLQKEAEFLGEFRQYENE